MLAFGSAQGQTTTQAPAAAVKAETPVQVVERQLKAYNARDAAAFAATYADNVELLDFPAQLQLTGRAKLQAAYTQFFASAPKLRCEILHRSVFGNRVIDHERVTGMPDGKPLEAMAVYEVENGLIRRVTFIK
ncbi:nuclear transport factor 2 family protein [Hymenobacter koreensis]|uniref:Nuclear transport factor 2 family protein n=2 Tax=Hymenobacter koreensis TaxID=1084523 RepID=A0ABP8IUI6_9BACT